jgi:hypothetical protein
MRGSSEDEILTERIMPVYPKRNPIIAFYSSFPFMQDNLPGDFHARSLAPLIFP